MTEQILPFTQKWIDKLFNLAPKGTQRQYLSTINNSQDTYFVANTPKEFMSIVVTPKKVGNKIVINAYAIISEQTEVSQGGTIYIHKNDEVQAVAISLIGIHYTYATYNGGVASIYYEEEATSLEPVTFKIKAEMGNGRLNLLHRTNGGGYITPKMYSHMTAREIQQ